MKRNLSKIVLAAALVLGGVTSAWASSTTDSAGASDNSTPFNHNDGGSPVTYYDDWVTKDYTISGNGTYTFNFTCTSSTAASYYGWYLFLGKSGWSNIWDTYLGYRSGDGWIGWPGSGQSYSSNTYSTANPTGSGMQQALSNASVLMTVERTSTNIRVEATVTPASENPFKIYVSYYYAGVDEPTADLKINFGVEYAYVNITSSSFEAASTDMPTPVYSNDFSSTDGLTIMPTSGTQGKFVNDVSTFGQVFKNAASTSARTNYLLLPSTVFSSFTAENAKSGMTIGFWVNAKETGGASNYTYAPFFGAYSAAPSTSNTSPMLCLQSRGLMQLNSNGWCDFNPAQNANDSKSYVYNTNAHEAGNDSYTSGGNWIDDNKWHYYTVTITPRQAIIYLDGVLKNQWDLDGTTDGQIIAGFFAGGASALTYVALGGDQAWDWNNNDAAFMFDDFVVYDQALSASQIAEIIEAKKFSYTVKASYGGSEKTLATGTYLDTDITEAYPRYILDGTTLYEAAAISSKYSKTFTVTEDNQVETITYDNSTTSDVFYYTEAEDVISGATTELASASNGLLGGRQKTSSSYTDLVTLPAGTWTIYTNVYVGNSGSSTVNFKVGSEVKYTFTRNGSSYWYSGTSEAITIDEAATLSVAVDGGSSTGIDWIYVKGTSAYEVVGETDCTTGYATALNTTPIWINAGETGYYKFINHNSGNGSVWNNWNLFAANESSENLTILRADNYALTGGGTISSFPTTETLVSDLAGATVELTVSLADAGDGKYTLTSTAHITKADGTEMSPDYVYTQTGFTVSKLKLYVSVDNSWLELVQEAVKKDITSAGYATYYSNNALDFANADPELTASMITGAEGSKLTLSDINDAPAETGVILAGSQGTYTIPVIASSSTSTSGNLLKGVHVDTVKDAESIYVLMNGGNGVGFYKNNYNFTVGANTAYLATNDLGAREFYGFQDDMTGIESVNQDAFSFGEFFDLQGRRIAQPTKGLYIMNGKKIVIK